MRGDLVYEKLGEIDPALLEDALQVGTQSKDMHLTSLDTLLTPQKRRKAMLLRRVALTAACILLAGLLLVGGVLALSRISPSLWGTEPAETDPPDYFNPWSPLYEGTVSIDGFGALTGSDELEGIGDEIKTSFAAARLMEDVCECERDLSIHMGETTLTYNRDHGCFRDGDTGKVYQLLEQDREYINNLLADLESHSHILSFIYEYDTLRRGDDFVFSVGWLEGYGSFFQIDKVYLRYEGEDTEYVTPGFFTVSDQENTYRIHIKDDAPCGKYTLVAHVYSPYTGRNIEMDIPSATGAIEILPNEKEPAYAFSYEMNQSVYTWGDTLTLRANVTNLGDDLYRFGLNTVLHPTAELRLKQGNAALSCKLTDELTAEDGHQIRTLRSGETGESGVFVLYIAEDMPVGVYDLVMSFEDHTQVFESAVAVMATGDCSYNMLFSITDTGDERTLKLHVTLRGKDIYRYDSSTCFAPDSLYLICEDGDATGVIVPELTAVNDGPIVKDGLRIRHWKEGESMIFTYSFKIDLKDEINGTIPGVHDLVVNYKGEESVTYEGALIVEKS